MAQGRIGRWFGTSKGTYKYMRKSKTAARKNRLLVVERGPGGKTHAVGRLTSTKRGKRFRPTKTGSGRYNRRKPR